MPGLTSAKFESSKDFTPGTPMQFVVRAKVTSTWGWVSRGEWSRVITPVDTVPEANPQFSTWWCNFVGNGQYGYSFRIPAELQSKVRNTKFESLLGDDPDDFGQIQVFNIDEGSGVAQLRCSCTADCAEPLLFRLTIEDNDDVETVFYGLYEPRAILPPRGGECETYYDTNDDANNENQVVSGLTFVVVRCGGWSFFDGDMGIVGQRVYYQSSDGAQYPRNQTLFGPIQFTVPCGDVLVISEVIGFGDSGNTSQRIDAGELDVESWTNDDESLFLDVQDELEASPNEFLERVHLFSTVKTMDLPCFPSGTFSPLDADEILDDILDDDPPTTVEDVLDEAPIVAAVSDNEDRCDDLIERFDSYLEVVAAQGDLEDGDSVSAAILEGLAVCFNDASQDSSYELLADIQTALLCLMECGEDAVVVESGQLAVGAQSGTLEQLAGQPIEIGDTGALFQFPSDISELEETLGKETCVYAGTSFVEAEDETQIPAASLSFYTINCTTGEREEVIVTVDGEFIIILPLPDDINPDDNNDECGNEEDEVSCVSGDTLSALDDGIGCRVISVDETSITCGCTHLTAFSALFVPGDGGNGCGGEWEWDILQTVAASLIAFAFVAIAATLLLEHFLIFRPRKQRIHGKTKGGRSTASREE
uniref:GPS domain-containing protein n=1 Tax=Paramoeba aestuarina TaxID=180227 RepID=A0A7S4NUI1_9EUKA|mmetsp:Transcript_28026/g.43443  ORF Transcript_28026/g.43443 Transcript_28026/m.43443 type:complete len:649 (+) Transcript_28026:698-2644(+)